MLDSQKVKAFWESRSKYYHQLPFESIANLEQDPQNLDLKIRHETQKVFSWLPDIAGKSVLDLGAGVGQWTFRFQQRGARQITAVEFSASLVEIGQLEVQQRGITNVEFVHSAAETYRSSHSFEVVFISGLMIYLNDDQAETLVMHLKQHTTPESIILLRDGTGVGERYEINNRFSAHLNTDYSATYRTTQQYQDLFDRHGFTLIEQDNMFPEGHPLNKYPETRLRLYRFRKQHGQD